MAVDRPVAIAFYADRTTYTSDEIWQMEADGAAMVEIPTLAEHRGRSLAPLLIEHSAKAMRAMGKQNLIAWVWWSHSSSRRAFDKAQWRYGAFAYSLRFRGSKRRIVGHRVIRRR